MGMSIIFTIKPEDRKNPSIWYRIIKRSILLILIGIFLNFFSRIPYIFEKGYPFHLRLPGIMQRLGLCYMITSLCYLNFPNIYCSIGAVVCFLSIYMGFSFGYKIPHCGNNHTTPTCNFGEYLDHKIFGQKFMRLPTDPEGIFTTLSALTNCFCGLFFMKIMKLKSGNQKSLLMHWGGLSVALLACGYFARIWVPICKKIWSFSFAFVSTGYSGLFLTLCFYIVDMVNNKYISLAV